MIDVVRYIDKFPVYSIAMRVVEMENNFVHTSRSSLILAPALPMTQPALLW